MDQEKTIYELNKLIEIQNDRNEGYTKAISELEDQHHELKKLFTGFIGTSHTCRNELMNLVTGLGGTPTNSTTVSGKIYRAWMDIRAALTTNDRLAVLRSCEMGEDAAQKAYESILKMEVSDTIREVLVKQKLNLKKGHDQVKALRDQEAEAHAHH